MKITVLFKEKKNLRYSKLITHGNIYDMFKPIFTHLSLNLKENE